MSLPETPLEARSPYLEGNYAPVQTEITASDLKVSGQLPQDLAGVFVRNSSNPRFAPRERYHFFDGDGMLHGIHFEDGGATYRNRYVRTEGLAVEEAAERALWTGIMERPDLRNPRGPYKDTANTDVAFHAGQLLALWWLSGKAHIIRLPELDTIGIQDYGGRLRRTISAHPTVDPRSGELIFFDYALTPPYLIYGVVSADGDLKHQEPIDLPGPRLQHDIAITERYSILFDMSLMFDPDLLPAGRTRLRFYREKPTRFGILPRYGADADVRWFEAEPCFMYHTINAWEEGDEVVLLGCRIANPLVGDPGAPATERVAPRLGQLQIEPVLYRWRFDLASGGVREEAVDEVLTDFPRMNDALLGEPSRYSYNPRLAHSSSLLFDGIIKYDLEAGNARVHAYPQGWFGGEASFVPREGATEEDDGYLLTFVAEERTGASELYVIDAKQPESSPIARVVIPQRVPTGYHTRWVGADDIARQREA